MTHEYTPKPLMKMSLRWSSQSTCTWLDWDRKLEQYRNKRNFTPSGGKGQPHERGGYGTDAPSAAPTATRDGMWNLSSLSVWVMSSCTDSTKTTKLTELILERGRDS